MKPSTTALWAGIIFGLGLGVSEMTRPPKVLGFLNVFGNWDPTLLVVFAAATAVYFLGYHFLIAKPLRASLEASLPSKSLINKNLILGAILFGLGWGLVGLCPGPALTNVMSLKPKIFLFIFAMILGMYTHRFMKNL